MGAPKPTIQIHEFAIPNELLDFSGERYTLVADDQIQHEHFHRYLFALRFCEGKDVLDVGSGEGYGAALLGTVAQRVVGVDSSAEAILHAGRQHASENVTFELADATALPLSASSVDTVVCFETLEHLTDHDGLLGEISRVLRPDGILLLSTPDRETYLAGEAPNPYHLREVNEAELGAMLGRHFRNVVLGGQTSGSSSAIVARGERPQSASNSYFNRLDGNRFESSVEPTHPVYLIALASDAPPPALGSSVLMDSHHLPTLHASYRAELTRVWAEVTDRDKQVNELETTLAIARSEAAELRREADEAGKLERALEATAAQIANLTHERDIARIELGAAYASVSWRITVPLRSAKNRARAFVGTARRIVRLRTRLAALRKRADGASRTLAVRDAPTRRPLLKLAGEGAFPAVLRDPAIAQAAELRADRVAGKRSAELLAYRPLVSILMPTYDTPVHFLELAVGSVIAQTYEHWELMVVDDNSTRAELHDYLRTLPVRDPRISVTLRRENGGISAATNAAMEAAAGDFIGMLDHDDELLPDALLEIVRALNADPTLDAVYTDQEYIERDGTASGALLKPDWSPRLLWGVMYVGHFLVVRRSVALSLGGFDSAFDNVQDFEFMLRLSERTTRIAHVPKKLYRWRRIPGSVAFHGDEKSQIDQLQAAAVTAHLERIGVAAVARPHRRHAHRATIVPRGREAVSVSVVLSAGDARARDLTRKSLEESSLTLLHDLVVVESSNRIDSVMRDLRGDYVMSLDAGIELTTADWLDDLLLYAVQPDVGAVSAVILDRHGKVEQAGLIVGTATGWSPAMEGRRPAEDGHAGSLSCAREVSAVTGACALISRSKLDQLGGFSGAFSTASLAWIDLSARAASAGLLNVVTPRCVARRAGVPHSDGQALLDRQLLLDRWSQTFATGDPFHNPNFADVAGGYGT